MKRHPILIVLAITGLVVLGFWRFGLSQAAYASTEDLLAKKPVQGQLGTSDQPLQDWVEIDQVLTELSRRNLEWLRQPGWLHYKTSGFSEYNSSGFDQTTQDLSLNDLFASKATVEEWIHVLTEQGDCGEYLFISRDETGRELQRVVNTADGLGGNLTLLRRGLEGIAQVPGEERRSQPARFSTTLVDQALAEMHALKDVFKVIQGWEESWNGRDAFVLYMESTPTTPIKVGDGLEPVVGGSVRYVFDIQTGQLQKLEYRNLTESGRWLIQNSTEYLTVEFVSVLPEEVDNDFQNSVQELKALTGGGK